MKAQIRPGIVYKWWVGYNDGVEFHIMYRTDWFWRARLLRRRLARHVRHLP